ncbi:hypothetical protein [Flavobacterium sp.]|uniref:hypothetical protein n=1 Tax=Flavobacterium sp. TaxID=239 RepID=UPI002639C09F|nr:hypothetical protein [Flavobacterium sp.]
MKKTFFIIPIVLMILSFSVFSFTSGDKQYDSKLVGIWKGFEADKETKGVEKHWIQERFKNGTYVIMFTAKQDCEIETLTEKGKWWTKDGKFYELSNNSKNIDIYNYEVKNPQVVEFKSIQLSGEKNDTYIFSDYRMDVD